LPSKGVVDFLKHRRGRKKSFYFLVSKGGIEKEGGKWTGEKNHGIAAKWRGRRRGGVGGRKGKGLIKSNKKRIGHNLKGLGMVILS